MLFFRVYPKYLYLNANLSTLLNLTLFHGNAVSHDDIKEIWGQMAKLEEKVHSKVTALELAQKKKKKQMDNGFFKAGGCT
jgi:hypothetical protein